MKRKLTFYTSLVYSLRGNSNGDGPAWLPWLLQQLRLFCTKCSLQGILGCFLQHSHKCTIRAFPVPMGPMFSQGRYLSGLLDNSYLIFWCYFQTVLPCFILANICPPLLSISYSYLQVGIITTLDYFRGLCTLEQLPWCLWSPYSSFLHFCLLFIPLLHEFKIQNSLSASVLKMPRTEWSLVDGDAMVLKSPQIYHAIAPHGTLSVQAALVQNCLLCWPYFIPM